MIIDETIEQSRKATISTSNSDSVGTFRIKESAKAFSILSSSLYQNPIRSIIRELGCNARDAHVAANNPKPWKLSLPSVLSPEFAVSDNGTGLSHEEVMQIYTTYFESTKTNSNEFVGALGLGSKSPFSYTDNFTVSSIKDGVRNIYSTFLTEEQIPSIVLLDSSQTTEPNGVEVRFSVKNSDFTKFREEALEALKFFDQLPVGFPGNPLKLEMVNGIEHIRGQQSYYHNLKPIVVMGGVQYTFDYENKEFGRFKDLMTAASHMIIRADIGDVDIQPSREALTMTKKTITYICSVLEQNEKKIKADIAKKISAEPTQWDQICLEQQLGSNGTVYEQRLVKSKGQTKFSIPAKFSGRGYTSVNAKRTPGTSVLFNSGYSSLVRAEVLFIINDTKQSMKDIHECIRANKKISVGRTAHVVVELNPINGVSAEQQAKELSGDLFGVTPMLTSELCKDLISKKKLIGIVYLIVRSNERKSTNGFCLRRSSQEYFSDGSFYVELDRENNVVDRSGKIYENFFRKYNFFVQSLDKDVDVFAIKHNSKFDRSRYINFFDHMEKKNEETLAALSVDDFVFSRVTTDYYVRNLFAYQRAGMQKLLGSVDDPEAKSVLVMCRPTKSTYDFDSIQRIYPNQVANLIKQIDEQRKKIEIFLDRYKVVWKVLQHETHLLNEMCEYINWQYSKRTTSK